MFWFVLIGLSPLLTHQHHVIDILGGFALAALCLLFYPAKDLPRFRRAQPLNRATAMNYSELIQLYFDRSTAMQNYWNLYVLVVGGILAFSSLRKQHAAVTTALVCLLFALFAYENLGAMKDCHGTALRVARRDQAIRCQQRGYDESKTGARTA